MSYVALTLCYKLRSFDPDDDDDDDNYDDDARTGLLLRVAHGQPDLSPHDVVGSVRVRMLFFVSFNLVNCLTWLPVVYKYEPVGIYSTCTFVPRSAGIRLGPSNNARHLQYMQC